MRHLFQTFVVAVFLVAGPRAQSGYFWWHPEVQSAVRDISAQRSTFTVFGTQEAIGLTWKFKNDEGTDRISLTPNEFHSLMRVSVWTSGRLVDSSIVWAPSGKWVTFHATLPVSGAQAVELEPGAWIEWDMSIVLRPPAAGWTPGEYTLTIDMRAALSSLSSGGRPWAGLASPEGTLVIRVDDMSTAAARRAQQRLVAAEALSQGRSTEAIAHFRAMIQADPTDVSAHGGLGLALIRTGQYKEAVASLERALPLALTEKSALPESLAFAYIALGDERNGIRVLRLVVTESDLPSVLAQLRAAARNAPRPR